MRSNFLDSPWLVMGDFNTPLFDDDKLGGSHIHLESRLDLRMFIDDNALINLDLMGSKFTWSNG